MSSECCTPYRLTFWMFVISRHMTGGEVLWAFEIYLAMHPSLGKSYALVAKTLYDEDIVEEEEMLSIEW